MFYEVSEIEMNGIVFPYRLDNIVLQEIQTKNGNIKEFTSTLLGYKVHEDGSKTAEPNIRLINETFPAMVREGFYCKNKDCPYTEAEIIRAIDKKPIEMALLINEALLDCITGKKKEKIVEPKKAMPTMKK